MLLNVVLIINFTIFKIEFEILKLLQTSTMEDTIQPKIIVCGGRNERFGALLSMFDGNVTLHSNEETSMGKSMVVIMMTSKPIFRSNLFLEPEPKKKKVVPKTIVPKHNKVQNKKSCKHKQSHR